MDITFKKAVELARSGVPYKIFPGHLGFTLHGLEKAREEGCISDLICDHYEQEDEFVEGEGEDDWEIVTTQYESIEFLVQMNEPVRLEDFD